MSYTLHAMINRDLLSIHSPTTVHDGAGVKLKRFFPAAGLDNVDPFVLLAAGQANNEPMVRSGPFVMNSQEEIAQTWREIQSGKFPPDN